MPEKHPLPQLLIANIIMNYKIHSVTKDVKCNNSFLVATSHRDGHFNNLFIYSIHLLKLFLYQFVHTFYYYYYINFTYIKSTGTKVHSVV